MVSHQEQRETKLKDKVLLELLFCFPDNYKYEGQREEK